jgi:hypothetical protein
MKRLTAALALVTVIGLMMATAAPASAASRTTTAPSVVSILDRVLQILGLGAPATPAMGVAPKAGGTAPVTPSPNEVIWGGGKGCALRGTC